MQGKSTYYVMNQPFSIFVGKERAKELEGKMKEQPYEASSGNRCTLGPSCKSLNSAELNDYVCPSWGLCL